MDLFGQKGEYLLLIAVGMVAVAIHAHNMYGQQLPVKKGSSDHSLLSSISVLHLGGRYQFYRGFALYIFLSEVVYLILASSSTILQMSLSVVGRDDLVGAISSAPQLHPLIPIAASTAVIAASQVKPFSETEQVLRRMCHNVAGIPRAVFNVKDLINDTLERELRAEERSIRAEHRNPLHRRRAEDKIVSTRRKNRGSILVHAINEADKALESVDRIHGFNPLERNRFHRNYSKLLCLYEWTVGHEGKQIWDGHETEEILRLFSSLTPSFEKLIADIEALSPGQDEAVEGAGMQSLLSQWRTIIDSCSRLHNEALTVLALLTINKPEVTLNRYPTLNLLRTTALRGRPNPLFNAIGAAVIAGAALTFVVLSVYTRTADTIVDRARTGDTVNLAELAPAYSSNQWDERIRRRQYEAIETGIPGQWRALTANEGIPPSVREERKQAFTRTLSKTSKQLGEAAWDTLFYTAAFAISLAIGLGVRHHRILDSHWWPTSTQHSVPPTFRYLAIGLYAVCVTFLVNLLLNFIKLAVVPALQNDASIFSQTYLIQFQEEYPRYLLFPLLALICVWFACHVFDRERDLRIQSGLLPHTADRLPAASDKRRFESGRLLIMCLAVGLLCGVLNALGRMMVGGINSGQALFDALLVPTLSIATLFATFFVVVNHFGIHDELRQIYPDHDEPDDDVERPMNVADTSEPTPGTVV